MSSMSDTRLAHPPKMTHTRYQLTIQSCSSPDQLIVCAAPAACYSAVRGQGEVDDEQDQ
jgi:hypothetical protein